MYIDFHGHSATSGMFFYSNDSYLKQQDLTIVQLGKRIENWLQNRLLPKVLQSSPYFSFKDSKFFSQKQDIFSLKDNNARNICSKEFSIPVCYSLETSYIGLC